jgi:hypothetical protein
MPAALRAVFGPRCSGRASPDLDRECARGFSGLERTEAERGVDEVAAMEAKSTRPEAGRGLRRIVLKAGSGPNRSLPVGAPRAGAGDLTRNQAWSRQRTARPDRSRRRRLTL